MTTLVESKLGIFERILMFDELVPTVKIRIMMFFIMTIVAVFIIYTHIRLNYKDLDSQKVNKISKIISFYTLIVGLFITFSFFPKTNLEKIYPEITENQVIKVSEKDSHYLESVNGKVFIIEEGRLRKIE